MRLICTVGLPRSGKSTWARNQGVPVVNPDAIRLAMHGQAYVPLAERHVWAVAHTMVRALFLAGHKVVILDATNVKREHRKEWFDPLWETRFKLIDTPVDECQHRAVITGKPELIPVIAKKAVELENLGEGEMVWDQAQPARFFA